MKQAADQAPATDAATAAPAAVPELVTRRAQWTEGLQVLAANKLVVVGVLIAVAYVLLGVIGPWIAPYDYRAQSLVDARLPPLSEGHLLGTDHLGRDLLSRILVGMRISLIVGLIITLISVTLGGVLGVVAGYFGGLPDRLVSMAVDVAWGFPLVLVAVLLVGAIGPGLVAMILAVGIVNWASFARMIRGETLSLRQREFIEAARALGVPPPKIIARHVLPHTLPVVLVMSSYYVALAVIFEAGFSFIGLGVQPPTPSLGQMVAEGREFMLVSHWMVTIPGVTIALIVIGLNMLGDGLRDVFDPRLRDR